MFAIGILAILLVYFLFFSNYFKIKNINLVDATEVNEEQIHNSFEKFKEKRRFLIFPAENIFLMDEERLRRIILDDNLYVEDVNIEKKLIDVIKVRVKEKVISAVWVSGSNLYYIDNYGKICCNATIDEIVERGLPAIYDLENKEINPGDEVVTQNFIGFLKELNSKFPEQINISVKKYWVPSILSREVHLETDNGFRVRLNVDRSVESQLNDLKIVIQEQLKNNLDNVDYIDLRVENWVYYK
jgi:cell division septal protein FtsQ